LRGELDVADAPLRRALSASRSGLARVLRAVLALSLAGTARAGEPPAAGAQAGSEQHGKPRHPLVVRWDAGLHVQGGWDQLHLKIGGDLQNDTAGFVGADSAEAALGTEIDGGVEWRRARPYLQGRLTRHVEFELRYDFSAGNPPNLKDAYVTLANLPIPTLALTAGRFKAPLGLDGYRGADDLAFMERSLPTTAFLPSRNTGVMAHGTAPGKRIRWSLAVLQPEADNLSFSNTDSLGVSARFAWAFTTGREKSSLIHLGVDYWRRNISDTIRYATRPESNLAPYFANTGDVAASLAHVGVLEAAFQRGPWTVQSELMAARVDASAAGAGTLTFNGFYLQGTRFLTGERMAYRAERGTFTRPYPKHSVREGGTGGMELALRYSRVDLRDGAVDGGVLSDWTAGFNWYPTYHLKLMLNAILAHRRGPSPAGIFQMRLQVAL